MTWRAVDHYAGRYEVSDSGRVRSLLRSRELTPCKGPRGYRQVTLTGGGRWRTALVHRLVAAAFLGERPSGCIIRHLDGDKDNNAASNLAYGTPQENSDDQQRHGTVRRGERHPRAKLTQAQVAEIRRLRGVETTVALAARFFVSNQLVSRIQCGHIWRTPDGK